MRIKIAWTLGVLAAAIALWVGAASGIQTQSDHKLLFEKARFAMETKGDLQGAIKLFQEIVAKYPKEKEYASKAQLYIGLCYEKLGNAEAIKAYELVLRNFADRPEEVAVARERLAMLRQESQTGSSDIKIPLGRTYLIPNDVSRDGTKIVGNNYDTGDNIVVYDTGASQTEFITHFNFSRESFYADIPLWSPDGKEIVYEQGPNASDITASELRAIGVNGTSRLLWRPEEGEIWPLDWQSDGSAVLAVWQHRDKSFTLGLVPASGGGFRAICPIDMGPWGPLARISPDGRFVVFTEGNPNSRNLRIASVDGKFSQVMADHPADDTDPLWSPDGAFIAFRSNRRRGYAVWAQAVRNGQPEGQPFPLKEMYPQTWLLNWTSQGIWFTKSTEINDIFIQAVKPGTAEPVGKPRLLAYGSSGNNASLRWSPDGSRVAFVSSSDRPNLVRVVVQPFEGGKAREFPAPVYMWDPYGTHLCWHADGKGLGFAMFAMNTDNKQASVFDLDFDSGEWKNYAIPDIQYDYTCIEWSPDSRSFFYANQSALTEPGIIARNLETGQERYLYRPGIKRINEISGLRWSHDRKRLIFHESEGGGRDSSARHRIISLDIETGASRTVFSTTDDIGEPACSPDGKHILLLYDIESRSAGLGKGEAMGIIPAAGGPIQMLKIDVNWPTESGFRHGYVSPDWSPDGRNIAFTVRSNREEVFLMKNVIPADKKKEPRVP